MNNPKEPAAELRSLAASLMGMYIALTEEGFTEHQALIIIGQMLAAARLGDDDK